MLKHITYGETRVGDVVTFQTSDNGFGGTGDLYDRTGVVTSVGPRAVTVTSQGNGSPWKATLREAKWYDRQVRREESDTESSQHMPANDTVVGAPSMPAKDTDGEASESGLSLDSAARIIRCVRITSGSAQRAYALQLERYVPRALVASYVALVARYQGTIAVSASAEESVTKYERRIKDSNGGRLHPNLDRVSAAARTYSMAYAKNDQRGIERSAGVLERAATDLGRMVSVDSRADVSTLVHMMVTAEDAMRDRKALHLRVHNTMTMIMDVVRTSVERRRAS